MEAVGPLRNIALERVDLEVDEAILQVPQTQMLAVLMAAKVLHLVQTDREALRKNSETAPYILVAAAVEHLLLVLVWAQAAQAEAAQAGQEEIQQLLLVRMEAVAVVAVLPMGLQLLRNMLVLAARVT